jgi:hypothetical protein
MVAAAVAGLVFAFCLAASFLAAFHKPTPHHVPVAVIASSSEVRRLEAMIDVRASGDLSIRSYPSAAAARKAIKHRVVDGAYLAGSSPDLLVASAGGTATVQLLTQIFEHAAAPGGSALKVVDVVGLPAGNSEGLCAFFLVLSVLLSSLGIGTASTLAARQAPIRAQLAVLAGAAVTIGAATVWVADGLTGALPGHYLALAGVVALLSLAISVPVAGLARLARPAGALAGLVFVIFGIPATGGPAGMGRFLPAFYRALNPALPPPAALTALTNTAYFNGHGITGDLWVLAAWVVAGIATIVAAYAIHQRHAVNHEPGGRLALQNQTSP